ncbi:hypothetical protein Tco_1383500 [Tanacetum coccineum]
MSITAFIPYVGGGGETLRVVMLGGSSSHWDKSDEPWTWKSLWSHNVFVLIEDDMKKDGELVNNHIGWNLLEAILVEKE